MGELVAWFEALPLGVEVLVPMRSPSKGGVITNPARFVAAIREDLSRRRRVPSLQGRLEALKAVLEGRAGPPVQVQDPFGRDRKEA